MNYNVYLGTGTEGKPYGGMTAELSDDEDPMQMGRRGGGAGMDDEEDNDLDAEMGDPRGRGGAHARGNMNGRQKQQPQQRAPYDDNEDF